MLLCSCPVRTARGANRCFRGSGHSLAARAGALLIDGRLVVSPHTRISTSMQQHASYHGASCSPQQQSMACPLLPVHPVDCSHSQARRAVLAEAHIRMTL